MESTSRVVILSGPSGVGKTTVLEALCEKYPDRLEKTITTTSRAPREGELDPPRYYFLKREDFELRIQEGKMIEYALVHGNYYGSTASELERITLRKKIPLYIVDPQGMIHLKPELIHLGYEVLTIFLLPPSVEELENRLRNRGTEDEASFRLRLANAVIEMEQKHLYDHLIVSFSIENTVEELANLLSLKKEF